jgi:tetratricopeptide (TPR) repeat protein
VIRETRAAISELEGLDDPRALATALCALAETEYSLGRAADALALAGRAFDTLRAADEDSVWSVAILNAASVESPLPVADAERLLGGLIEDIGMRPTVRAELMQGLAMLAAVGGRADDAVRMLDAAHEIEVDLGRTSFLRGNRNRAGVLLRAGRLAEARSLLAVVAPEEERRGQIRNASVTRGLLSVVDASLGSLEDARSNAVAATDLAAAIGAVEERTWPAVALSAIHLAEGDVDGALRFARAAVELTSASDWVLLDAEARMALARALDAAGDRDASVIEAGIALELCTAKGYVAGIAAAQALL